MQVSVYIAVSLDGYIARPDGAIDWLASVQRPGEDYGYKTFIDSVDALVMGRGTYETALGFDSWPYAGKRVVVATHRPTTSRHGETFVAGTPAEIVRGLDGARRIYIDGGKLITQFFAAGLVDDIRLAVIPIVLGGGIRLFNGGEGEHGLVLEETQSYDSGLVALRYRVNRVAV